MTASKSNETPNTGFRHRDRSESMPWPELRETLTTDRQREVFDGIVALIYKNGAYPTLLEIQDHLGLTKGKVADQVRNLDGYVLHRTAYNDIVNYNVFPRVQVLSPRLRSEVDRQQRMLVNLNRAKLSARRYSAKKRAKKLALQGEYENDDIRNMLFMQRGRCWWCQCELEKKFHVDHRIPLARGGSNDPENLCISCPSCNMKKGDKMPWEFCGRLL